MGLPLFLVDIGEAQSFTLSLVFDKRYEATFDLLFLFPFKICDPLLNKIASLLSWCRSVWQMLEVSLL